MPRPRHLLLPLAALLFRLSAAQEVVIESATREISLVSQVATVTYKLSIRNVGKEVVESVLICHPASHAGHEAVVEIVQDREVDNNAPPLRLAHSSAGADQGAACVLALLNFPLRPGKKSVLEGGLSLTQLQTPFPAAIFQNEAQSVLYKDNVYLLSPYKVAKQTTKVKLPSKTVHSYSKVEPTLASGKTIKYGEYRGVEPFTQAELRLHFENNSPFAVATSLVKEVEISHWGNVYIEERYTIRHAGARQRGEWSRLDLMRDPQAFGKACIRGFLAHLPVRAHSIYFKDAIGNISSSHVKRTLQATELTLTPRYPLFGGWQAEFVLGYSVPLSDAVFKDPQTGLLRTMFLFGTPLYGVILDSVENRVVLPEGSNVVNIGGSFDMEAARDKKYTYLDTSGRPVVVLRKKNVVPEHNQPVLVDYSFSSLSLLWEPLLLVAFFVLVFVVVIGYNRCNFVITRGAEWRSSQKTERTAFLLQEITAIVAGREKELGLASSASKEDITALVERLKRSEEKLKARCLELEQIAGPTHSAKVRDLLEKERALQAKISQIAATQSQLLQKGTSQKDAQAKAAEDLQAVVSGIQKAQAAKLQSLN